MKILVIENDNEIVEAISLASKLRWPEAELIATHLGQTGIEMVEKENPDVILLDLGLPDISGYEVLKEIRLFSHVPVMILSVMGEKADILMGMQLGADDYMVKPFTYPELFSRTKALLRRQSRKDNKPQSP